MSYNTPMNIGIIMAGGTGSRMERAVKNGGGKNANHILPKQFIELGGKPIIIHSLDKFLESACFDAIYIGMHPEWVKYMGSMISGEYSGPTNENASPGKLNFPVPAGGLHIIAGGEDRNATLLNVLNAIESDLRDYITSDTAYDGSDNPNIDEYDPIILTHDAARPFITVEMIEQSLDAARSSGASTLAIPTTDTIGVAEDEAIRQIPDRKTLYNIQTPQTFRLSAFKDAYSSLLSGQTSSLTDVCGVFTLAGLPVSIVDGSASNIKITTSFDLALAKALLED